MNTPSTSADLQLSRLSQGEDSPRWVIAVFAHNEAGTIRAALNSIVLAAAGRPVSIYVLANGCTDSTAEEVRACAETVSDLSLVQIKLADKAHAWNVFIHDLFSEAQADDYESWFFMDGDVTLTPDSMPLLESELHRTSNAEAAGGMPASGRDMDAWRQRMVMNGMLAGNFYALRGSFVGELRKIRLRMPVGLIGEDFLVSWLVANTGWRETETAGGSRSVFEGSAEFEFRSLSPGRLADYSTYLRRKWRYTLRDIQHQMLTMLLMEAGFAAMPVDVEELYRRGPLPSRLQWVGILQTPLRFFAMQRVRSFRPG